MDVIDLSGSGDEQEPPQGTSVSLGAALKRIRSSFRSTTSRSVSSVSSEGRAASEQAEDEVDDLKEEAEEDQPRLKWHKRSFIDLPSLDKIGGAKSSAGAKEKKLNRCLVLQYHDLPDPPFALLRKRNVYYARKHGYDYRLHDGSWPDRISPYWGKVRAVLDNLTLYDYILFLDSDAVVHDDERRMESLFEEGKEFVFSPDIPGPWISISPFCAGVFLVRSSPKMIEMFTRWLSLYEQHRRKWHINEEGRWYTKPKQEWAGPAYEQGSFVEYFLDEKEKYRSADEYRRNRADFAHLFQCVSSDVLQADPKFVPTPVSYTLHFAGGGKEFIDHYVDDTREAAVRRICKRFGIVFERPYYPRSLESHPRRDALMSMYDGSEGEDDN